MGTTRLLRRLFLVAVVGASVLHVQAGDRPPLHGWFQLSDARSESTNTSLTLHLLLFNLQSVDLEQVELRLTSAVIRGGQLESIPDISVPAHGRLRVAAEVTILTREYERWLLGATPRFDCVDTAIDGERTLGPIELIRREFVAPSGQDSGGSVEIEQTQSTEERRP